MLEPSITDESALKQSLSTGTAELVLVPEELNVLKTRLDVVISVNVPEYEFKPELKERAKLPHCESNPAKQNWPVQTLAVLIVPLRYASVESKPRLNCSTRIFQTNVIKI